MVHLAALIGKDIYEFWCKDVILHFRQLLQNLDFANYPVIVLDFVVSGIAEALYYALLTCFAAYAFYDFACVLVVDYLFNDIAFLDQVPTFFRIHVLYV